MREGDTTEALGEPVFIFVPLSFSPQFCTSRRRPIAEWEAYREVKSVPWSEGFLIFIGDSVVEQCFLFVPTASRPMLLSLPIQLHRFLQRASFNNSAGEKISFDQHGQLEAGFDIISWVTFPNQSFLKVKVGEIEPEAPLGVGFALREDEIVWPSRFNQVSTLS